MYQKKNWKCIIINDMAPKRTWGKDGSITVGQEVIYKKTTYNILITTPV